MKSRHLALATAIILVLVLVGCRQSPVSPMSFPKDAPLNASGTAHGCTSFCLQNDGYCIFGTNHDNSIHEGILYVNKRDISKTSRDRSTTGKVAHWTSKYGSLTFNLVGYQFPWAGMNETGLVISTMALEESLAPAPDGRPPLESPLWIQYQLDNSSTVEQVIASESSVRYASGLPGCCHYLVCDRTGNCATIEFLDGEMVAHVGNTLSVAALTNNIYDESVQAWHESTLEQLAEVEESVFSLFRFALAADRVTGFNTTDSESAVEYAFDVLAQASDPWTVWSIVFDSQNLRVHFHTSGNSQIRTVDLNSLDFTCGTPVLMLDINADLSGDVGDDLQPYAHEASLDNYLTVLRQLGIETSADQIGSLLRQMERFPCANGEEHIDLDTPQASPWIWLIPIAVLVFFAVTIWYEARKTVKKN